MFLLLLIPVMVAPGEEQSGRIEVRARPENNNHRIELVGLNTEVIKSLVQQNPSQEEWSKLFGIYVGKAGVSREARLPVGGKYRIENQSVLFEPRYPLLGSVSYRAILAPQLLLPVKQQIPLELEIKLPKEKSRDFTRVQGVFPSSDQLPENQLKFYLYFSGPMSRGEAYQRIQLLNEEDKPVFQPFLELDEELWDPSGTRFTLFFDPGRIKRGLKPREDIGPVLQEGKRYTLVIDRRWADASGRSLEETVRKRFVVLPPEDRQPKPAEWKLQAPRSGTTDPLIVQFPSPLDQALLQRFLWVELGNERTEGTIKLSQQEKQWEFTPKIAWKNGNYSLMVDHRLEDLAGNSTGKPFEVDVFRPVQKEITATVIPVPFVVR